MAMTKQDAVKLAKEMAVKGVHYRDIAEQLKEKGYKNPFNGKPLTEISVSALLIKHGFRKRRYHNRRDAKAKPVAPPSKRMNSLDAVIHVLQLKISAEERIALAQLILELK